MFDLPWQEQFYPKEQSLSHHLLSLVITAYGFLYLTSKFSPAHPNWSVSGLPSSNAKTNERAAKVFLKS
jgi:hypothetical protein